MVSRESHSPIKSLYISRLLFFLPLIFFAGCGAPSPSDAVNEFQRLYILSRLEQLPPLMTESQQGQWNRNLTVNQLNRKLVYEINYKIQDEKIDGDSATVNIIVTQRRRTATLASASDKKESKRQTFNLKKSGGQWLIDRIGTQEPVAK